MTVQVVLATKNPDKLREMEALLAALLPEAEIVTGLEWPDVAETGDTLAENALLKARTVSAATGLPAIADDTGLEVDALGGRPGVYTARFAGPDAGYADNRAALLRAMEGVTDRAARFRTSVAFVDGEREVVVSGTVEGSIGYEERGSGGFGYDPVFLVDGISLAEMGDDAKHRISHRARALAALAEVL